MYEAMFRVIKESENVDERQHCFLIQSFGKQSHLQLRELVGPLWRDAGKTFQTEAFLPILTKNSYAWYVNPLGEDSPSVKAEGLFL